VSKEVRTWIRGHNQQVKQTGQGVRIIACYLPIKSPWLNPIEPRWIHSKRKIVEPVRLLSAHEVEERVCSAFHCPGYAHLSIPEKVP
jgi:transposase